MSQVSQSDGSTMEDLSALMDGELDSTALARICDRWRDDGRSRAEWHAYQLIGDVLRSDDLASTASHDRDFLAAVRMRLGDEPVVLAPSMSSGAPIRAARGWRSWAAPAAVAASFAAVAGVLLVTQMSSLPFGPATLEPLAAKDGAGSMALIADAPLAPPSTDPMALNGQLVRDVRLDEYLAAHKKFGGSSAPGGPSGFLRNATVESRGR